MAGAVSRRGPARTDGAQPGAAYAGAGDHAGDRCCGGGLARATSHLGSQEVAGAVAGGPTRDMLAGGEHAGGSVAARRAKQTPAIAAAGTVGGGGARARSLGGEWQLVGGLQGLVPHWRRGAVRAADGDGRLQPLYFVLRGGAAGDVCRRAACMTRVFQEYGLPGALRTDNGNPFARRDGLGGLSQLSVWLLKLDIWPDRIAPRRPDMNGRHERMHRVLREDTVSPPAASVALQQRRFDDWRMDYNTYRPHEALGQRCPARLHAASARRYPEAIAPWSYPADHHVRKVVGDGHIVWRDRPIYLSAALRGETVGLARRDDGDWAVRFRGFDLAIVTDAGGVMKPLRLSRTTVSG